MANLPLALVALPCLAQPLAVSEDAPGSEVTTNRLVASPARREFAFPATGVFVSADFAGGRLSDIRQNGVSSYTVTVEPENYPVNDSSWYAFKIWSASNQTVQVTFTYAHGTHRYLPKISHNGEDWQVLSKPGEPASTRSATFTLELGPQPLFVAGQELFTTEDFDRWVDDCARLPFVKVRSLGPSTRGRTIRLMELTEAATNADQVILLGRQHPPEVTGTFALRAFVKALCADSETAKAFRHKFRTIVVPLLNPDGVDGGHWRHNANGVDLNRDWGQFNQAETRLVSRELLRLKEHGTIRFGLDFHSTRKDVFYTTYTLTNLVDEDFSTQWLQRLRTAVPEYRVVVEGKPRNPEAPTLTAAAWMRQSLDAPALTYEVGDTTDRALIEKVAAAGAAAMMEQLAADPSRPAAREGPVRVALYKGPGTGGAGPGSILRHFSRDAKTVVTQVEAAQIRGGGLKDFDVVVFAGGSGSKQAESIGSAGREQVREFVRSGGGYLGICAGSYLATAGFDWGLGVLDARTRSALWQRGKGKVKIQLSDAGRKLLRDTPRLLEILYANGPILQPAEIATLEDYEVLAWFRTELAENHTPKGIMVDSPAIVRGSLGRGRVLCFSPHPEQTPGLETFLDRAIGWLHPAKNPVAP